MATAGVAAVIITAGRGKQNAYGQRLEFGVIGLMGWLERIHPSETWFSGSHWKDNHRKLAKYQAAELVALDYDWGPAHETPGGTMPADEQGNVLEVVRRGLTHARIAYTTPRGMRLLVLCEEPIASTADYRHLVGLLQTEINFVLGAEGVSPLLRADPGNTSGARIMWAPNISDGDFARTGTVIESTEGMTVGSMVPLLRRAEAMSVIENLAISEKVDLAAAKKQMAEARHRAAVAAAYGAGRAAPLTFCEARDKFCAENQWVLSEYPNKGQRYRCPACGGSGFSRMSDTQWFCFSTRHVGVAAGSPVREEGHVGNILDLVAFVEGKKPVEILKTSGFL